MKLTDEQQIILNNYDKNIYVSAAPGSGKSTMLSKISEQLLSNPDNKVLLITFTNKAAKSIINKCSNLDRARISGGTFHGIAFRTMLGSGLLLNICDEDKKRLIIRKVFNVKGDKEKFDEIYMHISRKKSEWPFPTDDEIVMKYQEELMKYELIDFDDIIYSFINQLNNDLNMKETTHILVDELQDTGGPQLEMLKVMQQVTGCKMIGVADDDQCIYEWRGARPENVNDFIEHFNCDTLNMGYNFRSASKIVNHSAKLIEKNKKRIDKIIRPFKTEEGHISILESFDTHDEIDWAVMKCRQNKDLTVAILYRNRLYKNYLELALRKANIKYTVNDTTEITDRSAVKVVLSILKICINKFDIYDLANASKALQGLGKGTVDKIELASHDVGLNMVLHTYLNDTKYRTKLGSVKKLKEFYHENKTKNLSVLIKEINTLFKQSYMSSSYPPSMQQFMIDMADEYVIGDGSIMNLCNDLGLDGNDGEHQDDLANVELSTIHGAKGLEYDVVIMPWCGMYEAQEGKDYDVEAERRLFYVGITRAKTKLFLIHSNIDEPRFIEEMELD